MRIALRDWGQRHWFVPVYLLAVAAAFLMSRAPALPQPKGWDVALLIDLCVIMPVLFLLCYGRALSGKVKALRIIALACTGVLVAEWTTADDRQLIVHQLAAFRWVGVALIVAAELAVLGALVKLLFRAETGADELGRLGVPAPIARLMLLEARFWRWVAKVLSLRK